MSRIEWTGITWNPVTGCDRTSPGCDHCYALTLARRLKAMGQARYQNDGDPRTSGPGFAVTCHPGALTQPYRWRAPRLVFVNSMSDLFHARVPEAFIRDVFTVMAATPQHTYQVLTKRPHRAARMARTLPWPRNVWLGTSAEDQRRAEIRVPALLNTPAAVRFVSLEPLLGPIDLRRAVWTMGSVRGHGLTASFVHVGDCCRRFHGIGWVITGGESGPGHRPPEAAWFRALRDQCAAADVPFFFKQWGGRTPKAGGRVLDGRTWDQMPATTTDGARWTG